MTFEDYYRQLLEWEGFARTPLIAVWNKGEVRDIGDDMADAVAASKLKTIDAPIRPDSTNQSVGNQVEDFFVSQVNGFLKRFEIKNCAGAGYPDKQLCFRTGDRKFLLELKATGQWNPSDSNRRVLTSSSKKLRECFTAPINHLLLTVCYEIAGGKLRIRNVRLDFIQPATEVNVRLEASVNHKSLSAGSHPWKLI